MNDGSDINTNEDLSVDTKNQTLFKAVTTSNGRRGIRLEKIFWDTLTEISILRGTTLGSLVESEENRAINSANLTSLLRVTCLDWNLRQLEKLRTATSDRMLRNLLYACPIPALSLTSNRQLHSFNQPFINYVTKLFSISNTNTLTNRLRLVLDGKIETIAARLSENFNRPITIEFVIGIDEKRARGEISVLLMQAGIQKILVGYINK